jgi:transcriptional regulator with XRE-family HTH domain
MIRLLLANARKRHNMTQDELAKKIDLSRIQISRIEKGLHLPRIDKLLAMVDLLGPLEIESNDQIYIIAKK